MERQEGTGSRGDLNAGSGSLGFIWEERGLTELGDCVLTSVVLRVLPGLIGTEDG